MNPSYFTSVSTASAAHRPSPPPKPRFAKPVAHLRSGQKQLLERERLSARFLPAPARRDHILHDRLVALHACRPQTFAFLRHRVPLGDKRGPPLVVDEANLSTERRQPGVRALSARSTSLYSLRLVSMR